MLHSDGNLLPAAPTLDQTLTIRNSTQPQVPQHFFPLNVPLSLSLSAILFLTTLCMDGMPSKTRLPVPKVTNVVQNSECRIPKLSIARIPERVYSDVSSESATNIVPWNMQMSAHVRACFKTDGKELGYLSHRTP